jgi:hypothetical protein
MPLVVSQRLAWVNTPLPPSPAASANFASARGCRFERGRSFGLSFERLCSPGENKEEIQEKAGVQLKWARGKDTKRKRKKWCGET